MLTIVKEETGMQDFDTLRQYLKDNYENSVSVGTDHIPEKPSLHQKQNPFSPDAAAKGIIFYAAISSRM